MSVFGFMHIRSVLNSYEALRAKAAAAAIQFHPVLYSLALLIIVAGVILSWSQQMTSGTAAIGFGLILLLNTALSVGHLKKW